MGKVRPLIPLGIVLMLLIVEPTAESHMHYQSSEDEGSGEIALKSGESCTLPASWAGSWFQTGVHLPITINQTVITTKGLCVEEEGYKFVLYNSEDRAFRCVVFHVKHENDNMANVLQYKESYPRTERAPLRSLCASIQGDYNLFSMFRLGGDPIPCPFSGPFTFTYNRGHGDCKDPISVMDTCIQPSRLLLNYQACPDVPGTESHVEEIQCLATWKEGSSRFLIGLMQYRHPSSYEERFRCFSSDLKLHSTHLNGSKGAQNVIYSMSQSGDASCSGISPTEGSIVLSLSKAPMPKPCQFPAWLQAHAQWETLDQTTRYVFDKNELRISNFSRSAGSSLTGKATCLQILDNPSSKKKVTLVVHFTSECDIGYACMTIYRRTGYIAEVQIGNLSRNMEGACQSSYLDPDSTPLLTLTSPSPETQQCPQFGLYDLTGEINRIPRNRSAPCVNPTESTFSSGCTSLDTFNMKTECSNPDIYMCHGWWEDANGEEFLVATSTRGWNSGMSQRYCFAFKEITPEVSREVKSKKSAPNFEEYEDSAFDEGRRNSRKVFQFSRFKDTCRRHIAHDRHGELSFTVTHRDTCAQASTGDSSSNKIGLNIYCAIFSLAVFIRVGKY